MYNSIHKLESSNSNNISRGATRASHKAGLASRISRFNKINVYPSSIRELKKHHSRLFDPEPALFLEEKNICNSNYVMPQVSARFPFNNKSIIYSGLLKAYFALVNLYGNGPTYEVHNAIMLLLANCSVYIVGNSYGKCYL